jgi:hypothetical protein
MKLITEMSYDFELHEDKNTKDMFAVGIFSSAELKNNNKRVYKKNLLEREVEKVNEKVSKKCLWGELGHPPNPEVNPDKIAIRTTKLEWRGNDLYGKAKILDTPMGNIAKTLVKEGQMGISSRGLGTVGDDGYVNEDFHLITWDLVTDPSNNPSWVNGIYEGQEFQMVGIGSPNQTVVPDEAKIKEAQKVYFDYLMKTIDSMIPEAKSFKNRDVSYVVDDFVRFLIGDRQKALSGLNRWYDLKISIPSDPKDYNKLYDKLFDGIASMIIKYLDV